MSDRIDDSARPTGDDPRAHLVAYALGETSAAERAAVERAIAADPSLEAELAEIRALVAAGRTPTPTLSASYRARRDDMLGTLGQAVTPDGGIGRRRATTRRHARPSGGSVFTLVRERMKHSVGFRLLVAAAAVQIGVLVYLATRDDAPEPVDEVAHELMPKNGEVAQSPPRRLADPDQGEALPTPDRLPPAPVVVEANDDVEKRGLDAIGIGHGFQSREVAVARFDAKRRRAALARWGGSVETEAAVSRGLAYLRARQRADGSFPADGDVGAVRQTALTVLAFLGRALDDEDRTAVRRGVGFLLANQSAAGRIARADATDATAAMTHALATQCLVEARSMVPGAVDDEASVRRALGWMTPARLVTPRAVTQSGITLMVAGNLNFDVPRDIATHCRRWFTRDENRRRFEADGDKSERMFFAAGRVLFGGDATPSKVVSDLLERRPDAGRRRAGDLVAWLYAAQALRLRGPSRSWARWNDAMVAALLPSQDADGRFVARGEPAATALGVLLLETYYRYGEL